MNWIDLLQNLGIFGIFITASSWVIRKYFEKLFDKDIERYKADLEKQTVEFEIKYQKLHSERVTVIKNVYKKIFNTQRTLGSLVSPFQFAGEPSEEQKTNDFVGSMNDLIVYYGENKIFFEKDLANKIDNILGEFRKIWNDFQSTKTEENHREKMKKWKESWENIKTKIPEVLEHLENNFRRIIGIEYEN